jgi:hypothetical protein
MNRWLSPPVYIRDAYATVLYAIKERGGYSNTNVEQLLEQYWGTPAPRPSRLYQLWGTMRATIKNLLSCTLILPSDFGYWAKPYPYRFMNDDALDEVVANILKKAGIPLDGWFFESSKPLSWVNPNFLKAAYYLLNNFALYTAYFLSGTDNYTYVHCDSHIEIRYTSRKKTDNSFISSKIVNTISNKIVGRSDYNQPQGTYRSSEMLNRIYKVSCPMRGVWSLKTSFILVETQDFVRPYREKLIAELGERKIDFFDSTSVAVPSDAKNYVDFDKYLYASDNDFDLSLYEWNPQQPAGYIATDDLFMSGATLIAVTKENFPPITYKYYDPPEK